MFKLFRNRRHSEEHVDELLSAHLDGELTPDEQIELQALLEREPGLQERLESLRLTKEALAGLPQVEAPRNFILSPSMVAAPAAPAAPRRRPAWLALGWAATAAALLLVIVLAGDVFVVAPSTRQEPSDVVALVTDAPQPAQDEGYALAEVTLEIEEPDTDLMRQTTEEKAIEPAAPAEEAPVEAVTLAGVTAEGETEVAEQPVAEDIMPAAAENSTQDGLLAGTATQTPPAQRAMDDTPAGGAAPEMESQAPPPAPQPGPTATAPAHETAPEQPGAEPSAAPKMAVETNDDAQGATLATAKSAATEPAPPTWRAAPTPTVAPTPAPASGAPFWLRGLELVLGLSVVVLAVATWIARRRG
jgi:anti-sigma factor RsiW